MIDQIDQAVANKIANSLMEPILLVQEMEGGSGLVPRYATPGAAGLDLYAAEDATIDGFGMTAIKTGIAVAIPPGYVGMIRGRSGLAFKHNLWAFHGTIDEDYRGEVKVQIANPQATDYFVERGDRIAQMLLVPVARLRVETVDQLPASTRGSGGFGSTGR